MSAIAIDVARDYCCAQADAQLRAADVLAGDLKARNLWPLFDDVEMPLMAVLARMELTRRGRGRRRQLVEMSREMHDGAARIEREIYDVVGHEFNIGSPQQLSQILFDELGLPKTRRTKLGYTTDAEAMDGLRGVHPVVDLILRYRGVSKLKSTYVDALPALINPRTERIHTTFNQATAATGRLSSNDPNLQNIPVRTGYGNRIRRAFVARDIGKEPMLLAADYSQIELRIMAHLSQDPALIEAFQNDEDIHAATAANVFGVPVRRGDVGAAPPRQGLQLRRALRPQRVRPLDRRSASRARRPRRSSGATSRSTRASAPGAMARSRAAARSATPRR